MPSIPTPRPDGSGGFMVIQYNNTSYAHRLRVHLQPFNTSSWGYVGTGGTLEANPNATFAALVNLLKPYYTSDWAFRMLSLWQNTAGVIAEVFGWTPPTVITGSAVSSNAAMMPDTEYMFNLKTSRGGRGRITLLGANEVSAAQPAVTVSGSSGGSASDQAIVAYITGASTQIVGHDGYPFVGSAHLTCTRNRKLRRRTGQA